MTLEQRIEVLESNYKEIEKTYNKLKSEQDKIQQEYFEEHVEPKFKVGEKAEAYMINFEYFGAEGNIRGVVKKVWSWKSNDTYIWVYELDCNGLSVTSSEGRLNKIEEK